MQIGMLGAGNIGRVLGEKWIEAGHTVRFGVRNPQKPEVQALLKSLGAKASAGSIAEAISGSEVIVFAIPGAAMSETIAAHAAALDGKIIIDTANNMGSEIINSMADFAQQTPRASVYRAFNSYGWENFQNPVFGDITPDLFYCGTDGAARPSVEQLITQVGLNPIYLGGVDQAGLVDDVLRLWFTLAGGQKMGRHLTFKVLTR